ncbi:MAG TPA: hypothetical protein VD932_01115 [Aquabacterium sp.]|nr:hypothetical protein [Aquabacterium sp.]
MDDNLPVSRVEFDALRLQLAQAQIQVAQLSLVVMEAAKGATAAAEQCAAGLQVVMQLHALVKERLGEVPAEVAPSKPRLVVVPGVPEAG